MANLEIGDMILWVSERVDSSADLPDTGWVVHVEKKLRNGHDLQEYVEVHWLSSNTLEEHWVDWLITEHCKIIKGGQDDR